MLIELYPGNLSLSTRNGMILQGISIVNFSV